MFKKIIAIAALLTCALPAQAQDICPDLGKVAYTVMKARQYEVPKTQVYTIVAKEEMPTELRDVLNSLITKAYEFPVYENLRDKDAASEKYSQQVVSICYESFYPTNKT